jgi:hypothetical protein
MSVDEESYAYHFLQSHPDLKERIRNSKDFQHWRDGFKEVNVDASRYFIARGEPMITGGDRLMDEDELMLEWAQLSGIAKSYV